MSYMRSPIYAYESGDKVLNVSYAGGQVRLKLADFDELVMIRLQRMDLAEIKSALERAIRQNDAFRQNALLATIGAFIEGEEDAASAETADSAETRENADLHPDVPPE